jgi:hypothetical protein
MRHWLDRWRAARRLARLTRWLRAGRVQIANPAYHRGPNAVIVHACPDGLVFAWSRPGVGFGELTLVARDARLVVDTEAMSDEFALTVILQAVQEGRVNGDDRHGA